MTCQRVNGATSKCGEDKGSISSCAWSWTFASETATSRCFFDNPAFNWLVLNPHLIASPMRETSPWKSLRTKSSMHLLCISVLKNTPLSEFAYFKVFPQFWSEFGLIFAIELYHICSQPTKLGEGMQSWKDPSAELHLSRLTLETPRVGKWRVPTRIGRVIKNKQTLLQKPLNQHFGVPSQHRTFSFLSPWPFDARRLERSLLGLSSASVFCCETTFATVCSMFDCMDAFFFWISTSTGEGVHP